VPGGPFNVGTGGFPASFATIVCGPYSVNSRSQLRSDIALAVSAADVLRGFNQSSGVDFDCIRGPTVRVRVATALATLIDLAAMLRAYDAHLDMPHAGPPGPAGSIGPIGPIGGTGATGLAGAIGLTGPTGEFPTLGAPGFSSLLATIAAFFRRAPTTGALPSVVGPPPGERVSPGGTVSAPVVLGSSSDPAGAIRPVRPSPTGEQAARALQSVLELIRQIQAERALREAQRRAREIERARLAQFRAFLEAQRRRTMPFGQAGSFFQVPERGGRGGGGGVIEQLIRTAGDIFRPRQPFVGPGGFPPTPVLNLPFDLPPLGQGIGIGCPELFQEGGQAARPKRLFMVPNPTSGTPTFFGHLGRPLLFTRDVQGARKVRKLASRFARRRGGR